MFVEHNKKEIGVVIHSVPLLLNELSICYLTKSYDQKQVLVAKKGFEGHHVEYLKKKIYQKLFVFLRSPIILPTSFELKEFKCSNHGGLDVYRSITEGCFELELIGFKEEAEKLFTLSKDLKNRNDERIDNILKVFQLLSNYKQSRKKTKRLFYNKDDYSPSVSLFQLDDKAMSMDYTGINLFGR